MWGAGWTWSVPRRFEARSILIFACSIQEQLLLLAFVWRGTRNASLPTPPPSAWASRCPLLQEAVALTRLGMCNREVRPQRPL